MWEQNRPVALQRLRTLLREADQTIAVEAEHLQVDKKSAEEDALRADERVAFLCIELDRTQR